MSFIRHGLGLVDRASIENCISLITSFVVDFDLMCSGCVRRGNSFPGIRVRSNAPSKPYMTKIERIVGLGTHETINYRRELCKPKMLSPSKAILHTLCV